MNQLKKALSAVLAVATIATVFTGCGNKEKEEAFKTAMENATKIESYSMKGNLSVSTLQDAPQEEGQENVNNTAVMPLLSMDMDSTSMDKGLTTAMKMSTTMLGMGGIEQSVYLKDGNTYVSMDGDQTFIKQSMEKAMGMNPTNLQEMTLKYNTQFLENIDYSKVKFEDTDDGLAVSFAVTKDMYSNIMEDAINEVYPDGMGEQIRKETESNLAAMGMTEEEIASPDIQAEIESSVEMASKLMDTLINDLEFEKFDVDLVVNNEQVTNMKYDIEMNLKPIMEILKETSPQMAEMFPEDMRIAIKMDSQLSDINAITAVDMPEFTDENTMSMEEMMGAAMEQGGMPEEMPAETTETTSIPLTPAA